MMATSPESRQDTQDTAQAEAEHVAGKAEDAARQTADTAKQEARQVAGEATDQIKSLASSLQDEAFSQAGTQQQRLAEQSRTVTNDLQRLARGEQPEPGLVSQAVSMLAERAEQFTSQLENKEPADLLKDVRRFAARRPGTFLAIAAGIGLVAGRLTRGLTDRDDEESTQSAKQSHQTSPAGDLTGSRAGSATKHSPVPDTPTRNPGIAPEIGADPRSGTPGDDALGTNPAGLPDDAPRHPHRGHPGSSEYPGQEPGGRHLRGSNDREERR